MIRKSTLFSAALLIAACGSTPVPDQNMADKAADAQAQAEASAKDAAKAAMPTLALEEAANGPHRSPENIARNVYRHPVETLEFFGFKPDMTVVEIWPGGGWYSEVIAPAVGPDGKFVAASYAADGDPESYRTKNRAKYDERLKNEPIFANTYNGTLEPDGKVDIGGPASADMVVTFRNNHGWINNGVAEKMYAQFFTVLKPGGILGVVQHRANKGADPKASAKNGYVPQEYIIELATNAGFEFVEASEVNANPNDTKDHPEGVWTLPPSLRLKDVDKEKYIAIGESDRMTLKFKKPE